MRHFTAVTQTQVSQYINLKDPGQPMLLSTLFWRFGLSSMNNPTVVISHGQGKFWSAWADHFFIFCFGFQCLKIITCLLSKANLVGRQFMVPVVNHRATCKQKNLASFVSWAGLKPIAVRDLVNKSQSFWPQKPLWGRSRPSMRTSPSVVLILPKFKQNWAQGY